MKNDTSNIKFLFFTKKILSTRFHKKNLFTEFQLNLKLQENYLIHQFYWNVFDELE
jgi:hypothetical protein